MGSASRGAGRAKPTTVEAIEAGDQRVALEAMRDKLARDFDEAPATVVAQIAARLQAVIAEIARLPDPDGEVNPVDELARRRKDRIARAEALPSAAESGE